MIFLNPGAIGAQSDSADSEKNMTLLNMLRSIFVRFAESVIVSDNSGAIICWNDGAESLYGWSEIQTQGKNLSTFFPAVGLFAENPDGRTSGGGGLWRGQVERTRQNTDSVVVECQQISLAISHPGETYIVEISRDITESLREANVERSTAILLQAVMDNTSSYIHVRDVDGRFLYINEEYEKVFKVSKENVVGKLIEEVFAVDIAHLRRQMHEKVMRERVDIQAEIVETVDGLIHTYMDVKSPLFDEDGVVFAVYCIGTDITERKTFEASMEYLAHYDSVTGLPNRVLFQDRLREAIKKAQRHVESVALLFLDLDAFKDVNDTFGHECGDMLLKEVGKRLSTTVRACDTVARMGGDEFTVILERIRSSTDVEQLARKILAALSLPFEINYRDIYISASIGITIFPKDAQDTSNLMRNADYAMYASKRLGPANYCVYTDSMNVHAALRKRIISDLKVAIRDGQFRLCYQPIVSLRDASIHKAEALIRWEHPVHGLINPIDFISIAEETGDIVFIGNWVFREAVNQCADWRSRLDPNFQISINTSPMQYRGGGIDMLAWTALLSRQGLPGDAIVIEITEGLLMEANDSVRGQLHACSTIGMEIALDDFGTGYSSLSYLKKFDVDYLKIDRTFVTHLAVDSSDLVLCEAIVAMAHKLGLQVIAEGIETQSQRDLLAAAGCDFGQGYFFSKPVSSILLESQLANRMPGEME